MVKSCNSKYIDNTDCKRYKIPTLPPLTNLEMSKDILEKLLICQENLLPVGSTAPYGEPDEFLYFFSVREIPISVFLRSAIALGDIEAYNKNISTLKRYIKFCTDTEIHQIDKIINLIETYKKNHWPIGELSSAGICDKFLSFFGERELNLAIYLRGKINIGDFSAYDKNIDTLALYKEKILSFLNI